MKNIIKVTITLEINCLKNQKKLKNHQKKRKKLENEDIKLNRIIEEQPDSVVAYTKSLSKEIEKLEKHELNKENILLWRNSNINFDSLDHLVYSLEKKVQKIIIMI